MPTAQDVIAWYERKTESILSKYGPGPRIHFHTGLVETDTVPASDIEGLRLQLVQSQEDLLYEAAHLWEAKTYLYGTILDVGCGLGGGAIFWAQECRARVFALTNVPKHVDWIGRFSAQAEVADRVVPILGDACSIPGGQTFDGVVAIESSCYLDRKEWFRYLSRRIRPGGRVFIKDSFVKRDEIRASFDLYWLTRTGTLDEYMRAAEAAGFRPESFVDLTLRTARFWEFNVLYSRRLIEAGVASEEQRAHLECSIRWQTRLLKEWRDGGIVDALLGFIHS